MQSSFLYYVNVLPLPHSLSSICWPSIGYHCDITYLYIAHLDDHLNKPFCTLNASLASHEITTANVALHPQRFILLLDKYLAMTPHTNFRRRSNKIVYFPEHSISCLLFFSSFSLSLSQLSSGCHLKRFNSMPW